MAEIEFIYQYRQGMLQFPLFKFMTQQHARAFIDYGELYLPPMSSFSKPAINGSLINDSEEGFYEAAGLDGTWERRRLQDVWVYCVAAQLVSQSTTWAIKEGKTTCVMISDPKGFISCIQQFMTNVNVTDFAPCRYTDEPRRATTEVDKIEFLWHKPEQYRRQREVRFAASPKNVMAPFLNAETVRIPSIRQYLVEIDISKINLDQINHGSGKILHRVHLSNGKASEFRIDSPTGVYSMAVYEDCLGFTTFDESRTFNGPKMSHCHSGIVATSNFQVFALNKLEAVQKVELISIP